MIPRKLAHASTMALRMSLTALSVVPVGTTGIGNVAVSAMSGQGEGRVEMGMSGGPGITGDGVGKTDATHATAGIGPGPPPGKQKKQS